MIKSCGIIINEKKLAKYTSKRRSSLLLLLDVYFASFFSLIKKMTINNPLFNQQIYYVYRII